MEASLAELARHGEASPYYKLLGMRIEEIQENSARLSVRIEEKHIQFLRTVHGGVIASLADSAAAWAIYGSQALTGVPVTVEMKINFLKPVRAGKLTASARNIHTGKKIFVSDVDVTDDDGQLVAKSIVTYYVMKPRQQ